MAVPGHSMSDVHAVLYCTVPYCVDNRCMSLVCGREQESIMAVIGVMKSIPITFLCACVYTYVRMCTCMYAWLEWNMEWNVSGLKIDTAVI